MPACYLFVDKPVCALQAFIDTSGSVALTVDESLGKSLATNIISGLLLILVSGLNQNVFSGCFLSAEMPVRMIMDAVTVNPDGTNAGARITKLSKVSGLVVA